MNWKEAWTIFFVFIAFYFNAIKYSVMIRTLQTGELYPIFPWYPEPVMSRSSPLWMMVHNTSSLILVLCAASRVTQRIPDPFSIFHFDPKTKESAYDTLHYFEMVVIAVNCWRLVFAAWWVAMILNIGLIIWMTEVRKTKHFTYFVLYTIPVYLEFLAWLFVKIHGV
jgi:hypothetical protein